MDFSEFFLISFFRFASMDLLFRMPTSALLSILLSLRDGSEKVRIFAKMLVSFS